MVEAKKSKKVKVSSKVKAPAVNVSSIISKELRTELANSKISTRGRLIVGKVINTKANKTVRVEWSRRYYIPKYERFEKRRTRIQAHSPESLSVKVGDKVRISECRPISKTKKFVVIEKLGAKQQ